MIRIQIEIAREIAAQFNHQRAVLSDKKERIAHMANEISEQSYAEETVHQIKKIEKELEEAEVGLRQLSEGLAEICQIIEQTEEKVFKSYDEEKTIQIGMVVQQMEVCLNPKLQGIIPVSLRGEGEMYE